MVEKVTENGNENLDNKETVEEKETPNKTEEETKEISSEKENKSKDDEVHVGAETTIEENQESHSQVGDKSMGRRKGRFIWERRNKQTEAEVALSPAPTVENNDSHLEDNKSEVPSENIDEMVDEILAVTDDVDGKNSEVNSTHAKVEDAPMVSSESSEKGEDGDGGKASSAEAEPQSSVQSEEAGNDNVSTSANDVEKGDETEQRVSSSTAYRVQTGQWTE